MYIICVSMEQKLNNRRENVSLIKVNLKGLFLYLIDSQGLVTNYFYPSLRLTTLKHHINNS